MKKLVLIGSAITALVVAPLLAALQVMLKAEKTWDQTTATAKVAKGPGYEKLQRKRWTQ